MSDQLNNLEGPRYTPQPDIGPKTDAWLRERMPAFAAFRDATERVQKLLAESRGNG